MKTKKKPDDLRVGMWVTERETGRVGFIAHFDVENTAWVRFVWDDEKRLVLRSKLSSLPPDPPPATLAILTVVDGVAMIALEHLLNKNIFNDSVLEQLRKTPVGAAACRNGDV